MTEIAMPQIDRAGSKAQARGRAIQRFALSDTFFRLLDASAPHSPFC